MARTKSQRRYGQYQGMIYYSKLNLQKRQIRELQIQNEKLNIKVTELNIKVEKLNSLNLNNRLRRSSRLIQQNRKKYN